METGESGANGVRAVRPAARENNQENETATHQLLSMVESIAKETQTKSRSATKTFPAQVFSIAIRLPI